MPADAYRLNVGRRKRRQRKDENERMCKRSKWTTHAFVPFVLRPTAGRRGKTVSRTTATSGWMDRRPRFHAASRYSPRPCAAERCAHQVQENAKAVRKTPQRDLSTGGYPPDGPFGGPVARASAKPAAPMECGWRNRIHGRGREGRFELLYSSCPKPPRPIRSTRRRLRGSASCRRRWAWSPTDRPRRNPRSRFQLRPAQWLRLVQTPGIVEREERRWRRCSRSHRRRGPEEPARQAVVGRRWS